MLHALSVPYIDIPTLTVLVICIQIQITGLWSTVVYMVMIVMSLFVAI